jgi:hypothetical protein
MARVPVRSSQTASDMTSIRVAKQRSPAAAPDKAAPRPLTHHEILALVGPFTRRGHHVDMAASRRAERQLVFKPIEHDPVGAGAPRLREHLELAVSERGNFRLERVLRPTGTASSSAAARVTAAGPDVEILLTQVEGFDSARLFPDCGECQARRSYRLLPPQESGGEPGAPWTARLVEAHAEIHGVRLAVDADLQRMPVKVRLYAPPGRHLQLPRDMLAVLGRHWRAVDDYGDHWRTTIRVAKREPRRTRDVEAKFERTVAHLADTLARPPAGFHGRHRVRRWVSVVQRGLPLFAVLAMVGGTLLLANVPLSEGNVFRMLVFHLPPLLLLVFFLAFDELPPFEIPRIPRQLKQPGWLAGEST